MNTYREQDGNQPLPHVSVAPMMDWTTRHCRYFHRLIAPHVRLYTEMVTTGALLHGPRDRLLKYDAAEHPVALQLGGSNPAELAECARMGGDLGYDEINLNCGCPSDRVQNGFFGACLMKDPDLVARCVESMAGATSVPVTVKCRIAVDDAEEYPFLSRFLDRVAGAGCDTFIVHARKAWLQGLSPKENREIPPLRYDLVTQVRAERPRLKIILNGGIKNASEAIENYRKYDGVMIGRAAYYTPWILSEIESKIFGTPALLSRFDVAQRMAAYIEQARQDDGTPIRAVTRHMLGLFQDCRGARHWRRVLSDPAIDGRNAMDVIKDALSRISVDESFPLHAA